MTKDLYVRNIPPESGEEEVRKLFAVAGKVSYVHLVTDDKTGEFKGCGYVKMASEAEAKEAINCLDGARLDGSHTLSVTEALPQKNKAGGQREQRDRPPMKSGDRPAAAGGGPPAKAKDRSPAKAGNRPAARPGNRPAAKPRNRPPAKTGGRRK
jgi:RNA recognition motif-containing protein